MEPPNNETLPPSYFAILDAAVEEFAEKGYAGMRMEHVARRAGFNKSLVYRFFQDREALFRAALQRQFTQRETLLGKVPDNLSALLRWWSAQSQRDTRFMRMILREALEDKQKEPVEAEARSAYYEKQIDMLKIFQAQGQLPASLPPDFLFLALLAITIIPAALPQICQLATGHHPDTEAFKSGWESFLELFADHLKENAEK